jgi:cytochrome c
MAFIRTLTLTCIALAGITAPVFAQGDVTAGATIFKRCGACHSIGEGAKNRMGPELNGIVGQPAASIPDFNYSAAMKDASAAGLVWTPADLHAFLEAPKVKVPGTKMSFSGLKKPEDLDNVIAYIMSFSPDYVPAPAN